MLLSGRSSFYAYCFNMLKNFESKFLIALSSKNVIITKVFEVFWHQLNGQENRKVLYFMLCSI